MNWTKQDVDTLLQMKDRSIEEDQWELINAILMNNNVSDDEKLILTRKPKNLIEFILKYPNMLINGYTRNILHYYPF